MTEEPNHPLQSDIDAEEWLRRLGEERDMLDLFLAWRSTPANAQAFDKLAARRFSLWAAERALVNAWLALTPETDEARRNGLLDRHFELEKLILLTRSSDPEAVRAKVKILLWLMREQDNEHAPAMEDVQAFVEAHMPVGRQPEGAHPPCRNGMISAPSRSKSR